MASSTQNFKTERFDPHALPRRVVVKEVKGGRYAPGSRPQSWDARIVGIDQVVTTSGEELALFSSGQQSTPMAGWELLLTKRYAGSDAASGEALEWTLYGISRPEK